MTQQELRIELDWLKRWDLYSPDAVAIKDGDTGRELTYRELDRSASRWARVLSRDHGVGRGQRVALLATNEIESVSLFFALQRLGAILVPINHRLTAREVGHILRDAEPTLLLFQKEFMALLEALPLDARPAHSELLQGPGSLAERAGAEPSDERVACVAEPEDPCMIIYTSGTTGSPKGALLSHRMLFWNSVNTTLRLNLSQNDCTVTFLPFFHTGGWNVLTTPFLHRGAKLVFLRKFDGDRILELCDREQATILFGVPTTLDMMARSPVFGSASLKTLRYAIVGGEPMPLELIRAWHRKGVPIRQGYGLTEFGPNVFSLNEQDALRKIGSIGFPNFYIDAKVLGDDGREVPRGEIGELCLRGPVCMSGYWRNDAATAETIVDGWLRTGDLVSQDAEGYFFVVGRKKDMYKSGGENVYPAELEQVLRTCPGVRDVAVIGVQDAKWGEVGRAFIVRQDERLDEQTLQEFCSLHLAKFKIPKFFVFLSELPKGDSGKILKRVLRDMPSPSAVGS